MSNAQKIAGRTWTLAPNPSFFGRQGAAWKVQTLWPSDPYSSMRFSLIRILFAAHVERIDARSLVENLATEHRGWYRKQLHRLAIRMRQGTSLVDALEQTPGLLTADQVLAIRFGTQTGTLRETYQSLLQNNTFTENEKIIRQASAYWLVVLTILALVVSYLMFVTLPLFRRIFDDFGLRLPSGLVTLEYVKACVLRYPIVVFLLLAIALYLLISGKVERRLSSFISMLIRSKNESKTSSVVRLLAIATAAGRPMGSALSTLAKYHHSAGTRSRLLVARNEMEQGCDPWQSLASSKLLTQQESVAAQMLPDSQSKAWFLETVAHERDVRTEARSRWYYSMLNPIVILILGAIVLFIAKSFLGMNLQLIYSLT